jgi:hypothetical protein
MTFWSYLHRPPLLHLLAVIGAMLTVHVGLGTLLWLIAPQLLWWQAYLVSASSGIATAALLTVWLYRRAQSGAGGEQG